VPGMLLTPRAMLGELELPLHFLLIARCEIIHALARRTSKLDEMVL